MGQGLRKGQAGNGMDQERVKDGQVEKEQEEKKAEEKASVNLPANYWRDLAVGICPYCNRNLSNLMKMSWGAYRRCVECGRIFTTAG